MQKSCLLNVSKNYKIVVSGGLMLIYDEVSELQYFYPKFADILHFKIMKKRNRLEISLVSKYSSNVTARASASFSFVYHW